MTCKRNRVKTIDRSHIAIDNSRAIFNCCVCKKLTIKTLVVIIVRTLYTMSMCILIDMILNLSRITYH